MFQMLVYKRTFCQSHERKTTFLCTVECLVRTPIRESFDSVRVRLKRQVLKLFRLKQRGLRNTGREQDNEEARKSNRNAHESNILFYVVTIIILKRGQIACAKHFPMDTWNESYMWTSGERFKQKGMYAVTRFQSNQQEAIKRA